MFKETKMLRESTKLRRHLISLVLFLFIFVHNPVVKPVRAQTSDSIEEIPINFNIAPGAEKSSIADHGSVVVCRLNLTSLQMTHSESKYDLRNFNGDLCTHLVFSRFYISSQSSTLYKMIKDEKFSQLKKAQILVSKYPHLKVLLEMSMNDFNSSTAKQNFLDILTTSEEERSKFVGSMKHTLYLLKRVNFSGLQLDGEFYMFANKTGFALLAKELKEELGKDDLLLTTDIEAHSRKRIEKYYQTSLADVTKLFDLIFVRGYNFQNSDESTAAYNAPLRSSTLSDSSIEGNLKYLIFEKHVNPGNLVLDIPFFGRSHLLKQTSTEKQHGYGAKTFPKGFPGPRLNANSIWGYDEICSTVEASKKDWKMFWDHNTEVPFVKSGNKWISFDNAESIEEKVIVAKYYGLRGIMASNVDMDDFEGLCSNTTSPLLRSISYALLNASPLKERYDSDNHSSNGHESATSVTAMLGLASATFALLCILIVAAALVVVRRLKSTELSNNEIVAFMKGTKETPDENVSSDQSTNRHIFCADNLPYDSSYEIPSSNFEIEKSQVLQTGQFNVVYHGTIGNIPATVKMTKTGDGRHNIKLLLSELKTLMYVQKHVHIVTLLGASTTELKKGVLCVFMEVCPLGDLQDYLRNSKTNFVSLVENDVLTTNIPYGVLSRVVKQKGVILSTANLINWSHQTAIALEYLNTKKIVHGLLSTLNISLYEKNTVKLTDIGTFNKVYNLHKNKHQEPPLWRWLAVEVLQENKFSIKSDVWSFGVTLWEIFSLGQTPYSNLSWTPALPELFKQNLRMQKPIHATKSIYKLMRECWKENPNERPNPKDLVTFFSNLWESSQFKDIHLNITETRASETPAVGETTM